MLTPHGHSDSPEYYCPGQTRPISRAVHLGRMAAFYPGCRTCPHRDDTGTLSPRQIKRLRELRSTVPTDLWSEDGVAADSINPLPPATVRKIGATFGTWLTQQHIAHIPHFALRIPHSSAVLAGDGRAITAEALAALSEGLRWADVAVLDVGPATAACTAFTVRQLHASGGVQVGNPRGTPHGVGLKFWGPEGAPLFMPEQFKTLKQLYERGVDRPTRRFAACQRVSVDDCYYARFAPWYHGLRPLRFVVASSSAPWQRDLERLLQTTACTILPCRRFADELPQQVRQDAAHFGICVSDDGERCRVFDEQGEKVPWERLLQLLLPPPSAEDVPKTLVLEEQAPEDVGKHWEGQGGAVLRSPARRAAMASAVRAESAVLGAGPSGRLWYPTEGAALPDALQTLSLLLRRLSRSDRSLSQL